MPSRAQSPSASPHVRKLTVIAQDPSVRGVDQRILTVDLEIPAEELAPGPTGYRVKVVDYDVSTNKLYDPGSPPIVPKKASPASFNRQLLSNPQFHQQNVYAIVMRVLARFEQALGRRVAWGFDGHQIHVAPHAFAEANAFYSEADRALLFGYFADDDGNPIYSCLSHDVVAHETTHALLDGLRDRFTEPSSPDQAGFHEGLGDIVALLSVLSLPSMVERLLDQATGGERLISARLLTRENLANSVLLGLAEELGTALAGGRQQALRRSVQMAPADYLADEQNWEPHRRGELLVSSILNAALDILMVRLDKLGLVAGKKKDLDRVIEDGAKVADHLLTMAIRAIDYCPPIDLHYGDYLAALLTVDAEVVPTDNYGYREKLLDWFARYDVHPPAGTTSQGCWRRHPGGLIYARTHFESMLRDKEEVFRFIWENRRALGLDDRAYTSVESVRPSIRIAPDGFALRETVVEYVQIVTLNRADLRKEYGIRTPRELSPTAPVRIYGGGTLIFDEHGQVKYHIAKPITDRVRQEQRLRHLVSRGHFAERPDSRQHFADLHRRRLRD